MNIAAWFRRTFIDGSPTGRPLPPHVANLKLNMALMGLHMEQAAREQDPRTKVGYIFTGTKEKKS